MSKKHKRAEAQHNEPWRRVGFNRKSVEEVGEDRGLWYESPEQITAQLARGTKREVLLTWVFRQMERRLNARERRCVELYYLEGRSFREIAAELEMTKSAAERTVRGAVEKLRAARCTAPLRG